MITQFPVGAATVDPEDTLTVGGNYGLQQLQSKPFLTVSLRYPSPNGGWSHLRNAGMAAIETSDSLNGFVAVSGTTHPFVCSLWDGMMIHNTDLTTPARQAAPVWRRVPPSLRIWCTIEDEPRVHIPGKQRAKTISLRPDESVWNSVLMFTSGIESFESLGFLPLAQTKRGFDGLICQGEAPYLCRAHISKPNGARRVTLTASP